MKRSLHRRGVCISQPLDGVNSDGKDDENDGNDNVDDNRTRDGPNFSLIKFLKV